MEEVFLQTVIDEQFVRISQLITHLPAGQDMADNLTYLTNPQEKLHSGKE